MAQFACDAIERNVKDRKRMSQMSTAPRDCVKENVGDMEEFWNVHGLVSGSTVSCAAPHLSFSVGKASEDASKRQSAVKGHESARTPLAIGAPAVHGVSCSGLELLAAVDSWRGSTDAFISGQKGLANLVLAWAVDAGSNGAPGSVLRNRENCLGVCSMEDTIDFNIAVWRCPIWKWLRVPEGEHHPRWQNV